MKKIIFLTLIFRFFVCSVVHCQTLSQISGKVMDIRNKSIKGVKVTFLKNFDNTTTDDNGVFTFDVAAFNILPYMDYDFLFDKEGYEATVEHLNVGNGNLSKPHTLRKEKKPGFRVLIREDTNVPQLVENAVLQFQDKIYKSNAHGWISIEIEDESDQYAPRTLTVKKYGYQDIVYPFTYKDVKETIILKIIKEEGNDSYNKLNQEFNKIFDQIFDLTKDNNTEDTVVIRLGETLSEIYKAIINLKEKPLSELTRKQRRSLYLSEVSSFRKIVSDFDLKIMQLNAKDEIDRTLQENEIKVKEFKRLTDSLNQVKQIDASVLLAKIDILVEMGIDILVSKGFLRKYKHTLGEEIKKDEESINYLIQFELKTLNNLRNKISPELIERYESSIDRNLKLLKEAIEKL